MVFLPLDGMDLALLQQGLHVVEGVELAVTRGAVPVAPSEEEEEEEEEDQMITDESDPSSAAGHIVLHPQPV